MLYPSGLMARQASFNPRRVLDSWVFVLGRPVDSRTTLNYTNHQSTRSTAILMVATYV